MHTWRVREEPDQEGAADQDTVVPPKFNPSALYDAHATILPIHVFVN